MILISGSMPFPEVPLDEELRLLIEQRIEFMTDGEPFDPDLHGLICVVEPRDRLSDVVEAVGHDFLSDPWAGARFGDPEFEPVFEVLEEHGSCFELVIVPGDGDYGIVIFIPKAAGVDPLMVSFCEMYAVAAP
jgi:hypothetical protein